jgi:hypothetical protein
MKALEIIAGVTLAAGAVYVIGVIALAFCYHTLKALGM